MIYKLKDNYFQIKNNQPLNSILCPNLLINPDIEDYSEGWLNPDRISGCSRNDIVGDEEEIDDAFLSNSFQRHHC